LREERFHHRHEKCQSSACLIGLKLENSRALVPIQATLME